MELITIIFGCAILFLLIVLIAKLFSRKDAETTVQIMKTINENLSTTQGNFDTQFKTNREVISEIHNKLGSLETTTKNIQEIG